MPLFSQSCLFFHHNPDVIHPDVLLFCTFLDEQILVCSCQNIRMNKTGPELSAPPSYEEATRGVQPSSPYTQHHGNMRIFGWIL